MAMLGQPHLGKTGGNEQFDSVDIQFERNCGGIACGCAIGILAVERARNLHGRALEVGIGGLAALNVVAFDNALANVGGILRIHGGKGAPNVAAGVTKLQQAHIDNIQRRA